MKAKRKKERVKKMILNYLQKNPEAGDSLEGITRWWLQMERLEISVNEVTDALAILLQKKLVKVQKVPGSALIYRIND